MAHKKMLHRIQAREESVEPSVPIRRRDKPQPFRRQGTIDCTFGVGYRLGFCRGLASNRHAVNRDGPFPELAA
jgi:hypothetical protein